MRRIRHARDLLIALVAASRRSSARSRLRRRERRGDRFAHLASRASFGVRRRAAEVVVARAHHHPPRLLARAVLSGALPVDPLAAEAVAPIDVIIPCHARDAHMLPVSVAGALHGIGSALGRVTVIAPDTDVPLIGAALDAESRPPEVEVVAESDVVPSSLIAVVRSTVPHRRQGWALQQLVKLCAAAGPGRGSTLLLDADTVLLERRSWVTRDGRQLIMPSHELHAPYVHHYGRFWGESPPRLHLSFVTHHQPVQSDVLLAMFGDPVARGLESWLTSGDWSIDCPVSEYHDYGTWLTTRVPARAVLAAFRNVRAPRSSVTGLLRGGEAVPALARRFPGALSVSLHAYLG